METKFNHINHCVMYQCNEGPMKVPDPRAEGACREDTLVPGEGTEALCPL